MPSVFLSYRRQTSAELAAYLTRELRLRGVTVHYDTERLESVRAYPNRLLRAIESSDALICLVDADTFESAWVLHELQYAHNLGKPLLPIFHGSGDMPIENLDTLPAVKVLLKDAGMWMKDERYLNWEGLIARIRGFVPQPPVPPEPAHFFISYSRHDSIFMRRLCADIRTAGLKFWVDDEGLEAGTPVWEQEIDRAIRSAAGLIALLSPDARQSLWVAREIAMAETLDKPIFPVLVRGTPQDAIPIRLMTHQRVDARTEYVDALIKLIAALQKVD